MSWSHSRAFYFYLNADTTQPTFLLYTFNSLFMVACKQPEKFCLFRASQSLLKTQFIAEIWLIYQGVRSLQEANSSPRMTAGTHAEWQFMNKCRNFINNRRDLLLKCHILDNICSFFYSEWASALKCLSFMTKGF